jgi:hypothetical protein
MTSRCSMIWLHPHPLRSTSFLFFKVLLCVANRAESGPLLTPLSSRVCNLELAQTLYIKKKKVKNIYFRLRQQTAHKQQIR